MYYNLDLKILLNSVSEAIQMHGVTRFQNASGIPTGGFLDLLRLYLRSSLVEYEGEIFIQRSGVCIGSCLAPILSEIFLFFVDRAVREDLARSGSGCRIFRFVDDYLVVHPSSASDVSVLHAFAANARGLSFTKEDANQEGLQFLDLRLTPSSHGLCWSFQQRSQKPVLPFTSHHSKTVKSGIVKSLLSSSCKKSCPHLIKESLSRQTARLQGAGYPADLIQNNIKTLIVQSGSRPRNPPPRSFSSRPACIPYVHNTSHRLSALARKFDTRVLFTCKFKLGGMCKRINNPEPPPSCTKKHAQCFRPCAREKVYTIPLSCGAEYIGQTGRCINDRLREHAREITSPPEDSVHPVVAHAKKMFLLHTPFHPNKNHRGTPISIRKRNNRIR
ncbi:uncharacterized protein ISCGN_016468 [Ixodes scapularis]